MSALFCAVLISSLAASVGVHVVETRDVKAEHAREVADLLARSLKQAGQDAHVGHLVWDDCSDERACARDLAASERSEAVVLLRLFQTPSVLLVVANRARADGAAVLSASAKLPAGSAWELDELARALFPDLSAKLATSTVPPPVVERSSPPWMWIGALSGAVILGTGVGFGLSSASAREQLLDGRVGAEEIEPLRSRMDAHQLAANLCFGGALLTAGAFVLLEALE